MTKTLKIRTGIFAIALVLMFQNGWSQSDKQNVTVTPASRTALSQSSPDQIRRDIAKLNAELQSGMSEKRLSQKDIDLLNSEIARNQALLKTFDQSPQTRQGSSKQAVNNNVQSRQAENANSFSNVNPNPPASESSERNTSPTTVSDLQSELSRLSNELKNNHQLSQQQTADMKVTINSIKEKLKVLGTEEKKNTGNTNNNVQFTVSPQVPDAVDQAPQKKKHTPNK